MASKRCVISILFKGPGDWWASEGDGVVNPFSTKKAAIDFGTQRLGFSWGELRIHGENGTLERTIAFNDEDNARSPRR